MKVGCRLLVGRGPRSAAPSARRRRRRVRRSREGAPAPWPAIRVKPSPRVAALAAGIDAASMARRCQNPQPKKANVFLHPPSRRRGRVGRGSDRRRARRDAGGSPRSALDEVERGPIASARSKSKLRNPLNPAVQAGFRRTASRRAEPLPTLSHAKQTPARSANSDNSDNSNNSNNSNNSHRSFGKSIKQPAEAATAACCRHTRTPRTTSSAAPLPASGALAHVLRAAPVGR